MYSALASVSRLLLAKKFTRTFRKKSNESEEENSENVERKNREKVEKFDDNSRGSKLVPVVRGNLNVKTKGPKQGNSGGPVGFEL